MKREDLRKKIIPARIKNTDINQIMGLEEFDTVDSIYIESSDEQLIGPHYRIERLVEPTDYAQMNNAFIAYKVLPENISKYFTFSWLRSNTYGRADRYGNKIDSLDVDGNIQGKDVRFRCNSLRPALHYKISDKNDEDYDIEEVNDEITKRRYYVLKLGEYPNNKVDNELNMILEELYNNGKVKKGLFATGRWFSCNGQESKHVEYNEYLGKHNPEFEYNSKKYVRVISNPEVNFSDSSDFFRETGKVKWLKVEPISFKIKNWADMPQRINPSGTEKAEYFDLVAEKAIISNIPFYPYQYEENTALWQNSTIRGFLNGIDVRSIKENGNLDYIALRGGNFDKQCNFLNEAFNLVREPMIEYHIPNSEKEIVDNAFNGCITLKKLIIPTSITKIGKNAFLGLDFKFVYKNKANEIVLADRLPKNREEYQSVLDIRCFKDFDFNILFRESKRMDFEKISKVLSNNRLSLPYKYCLEMIETENLELLLKNTDYRYFKNEIPDIDKMLEGQGVEEQKNFYNFARTLGCFSSEKVLDKNGKETETILAQKATSFLVQILKSEGMKIRKL